MPTVSFGDKQFSNEQLPYFKASEGTTYRVHIPNIDGILAYKQHFVEAGKAGYARCFADRGEECPICKATGNQPIQRFKCNIIVYTGTNPDGTIDNPDFCAMQHFVLKFGTRMFAALSAKHKKVIKKGGLKSIDLLFSCTDAKYQKIDVEDCDDCAASTNPRLKAMEEKLIQDRFIDFDSYDDRDLKYVEGVKLNEYLSKATGGQYQAPNPSAVPDTSNSSAASEDVENLFDGEEGSDDSSASASLDDLI